MGILLLLIGMLAAGSGAVKLLRGHPSGERRSFATVEVIVGAVVILGSGVGLARERPLAWAAVVLAAVAVILSSAAHVRAGLRDQARRTASEERRFRQFLRSTDGGGTRNSM